MKPTEAKKWIDRLVKTGMNRDAATAIVDEVAKESATLAGNFANNFLSVAEAVSLGRNPAEPEPPPVEIPRRVVYTRQRMSTGHFKNGRVATVVSEGGDGAVVLPDDVDHEETWAEGSYIELRLTKNEQARLLLEKLSREAWEEKGADVLGDPNCYIINLAGEICRTPHGRCDPHTIRFPDSDYAVAARDTIIRAGLAWWEEGE